jgi:coenzyme F420-reducing hydrogenase delta subunit/heterodisulfide reductase subunit C
VVHRRAVCCPSEPRSETMGMQVPDRTFREEVLAEPGGENLFRCYSCGTCASICLVRRVNPDFNPRRTLAMVMLDMRERVLSSPTVWLCSACDLCYSRCPQEVHISELMQAIRNIAVRDGREPPGLRATVHDALCSGCGLCAVACPYGAIALVSEAAPGNGHAVAHVDKYACMGCGICAASCPSEALQIEDASREQIALHIGADGWPAVSEAQPRIIAFLCDWCVRAEDDLAGLGHLPPNVRIVHIPCTGHLDPSLVLTALTKGADGVLVVGCLPGECHFQSGNLLARRRIAEIKPLLDALGIGRARLRLEWISTSERGKVGRILDEFAEDTGLLGPNPLRSRTGWAMPVPVATASTVMER